jgi:integrase
MIDTLLTPYGIKINTPLQLPPSKGGFNMIKSKVKPVKKQSSRRAKGEGSIFFREDRQSWCAKVNITTSENKTKTNVVYGKTKEEVLEKKKLLEANITLGNYIEPSKMTVESFFTGWLNEACKNSLRPSTYARYASIIKVHINPALGKTPISKLTPLQIQSFYNHALLSITPKTVRNIHIVVHKALNQAVKWGLLARNTSDAVELNSF